MSSDYKIHRIHHFHHHHYHVHHLLDHHHLHIHNQTIHSHNLTVNHNNHNNEQDKYHKLVDNEFNQHFKNQTREHSDERKPALSYKVEPNELEYLDHYSDSRDTRSSSNDNKLQISSPATKNQQQLVQTTARLNQVIAPPAPLHHHHLHNDANYISQKLVANKTSSPPSQAFRARQRSQIQFFLVSAFAYILSPIDLIPEMIFGVFGIIDDLLFLLMCLFCIAIILLYPLFREARRTILNKFGIFNEKHKILENKSF